VGEYNGGNGCAGIKFGNIEMANTTSKIITPAMMIQKPVELFGSPFLFFKSFAFCIKLSPYSRCSVSVPDVNCASLV
jgi:hypothetical protein